MSGAAAGVGDAGAGSDGGPAGAGAGEATDPGIAITAGGDTLRADDVIYDIRTMVERVNARLKDEFGAPPAEHPHRSSSLPCRAS